MLVALLKSILLIKIEFRYVIFIPELQSIIFFEFTQEYFIFP